jgi:hypothetical protein
MISYAGEPLVHGDAALIGRVQGAMDLWWPTHGSRLSMPAYPGQGIQGRRGQWPPTMTPRVNTLYWPSGASRWACGWFLCDETALAAARASRASGAAFVFSDGKNSITTTLFMLPACPMERYTRGVAGLYILPLVDARYYWWQRPMLLAIDEETSTWASVYADIADALGEAITAETPSSAYLLPSPSLGLSGGPIPPILDLVALGCGQRVVRGLDGSVKTMNAPTSLAAAAANLAAFDGRRLAGDRLDLAAGV